jgi:hypothetical protein
MPILRIANRYKALLTRRLWIRYSQSGIRRSILSQALSFDPAEEPDFRGGLAVDLTGLGRSGEVFRIQTCAIRENPPMFRLFLAAFLFLGIANAEADEGPPNRLISDAIPAWRKQKAAEEHVNFTMQERRWATENGQSLDHWSKRSRKRLVRDGSSFLAMISDEGAVGEGYFGANPRYLFNISRPADTAPYVLRQLDLDASDKARADLQRQLTIFNSIARSRLFASIPLDELVTDPGFKLKRIEEVSV